MNITVFRIDDRLIHGQVVTRWIGHAGAKRIVVIDDRVAADPTQQMLLKFAVPGGIAVDILSKEAAVQRFRDDTGSENTLVLVRNPLEAGALFSMGFPVCAVNVGNISNTSSSTERKKVLDYLYLEEQDIAALQRIREAGAAIDFRAVPTESPKTLDDIIARYNA